MREKFNVLMHRKAILRELVVDKMKYKRPEPDSHKSSCFEQARKLRVVLRELKPNFNLTLMVG
jgi:hypothetical protein